MQYTSLLRIFVVCGGVAAAVGSASSTQQQPTGYYPRPQQQQVAGSGEPGQQPPQWSQPQPQSGWQQPQPQPGWQQPQSQPQPGWQQPQPQPQPQPQSQPQSQPQPQPQSQPQPEPQPEPPAQSQAPQQETKRTQWVCSATGWWQKCETQSYACYSQVTTMMGFGTSEPLARVSAETECNTAMNRMMSVNFTYRTSVTQRCKAVSCSPPNAK